MGLVAEALAHLGLERDLQNPLGQLGQQALRTDQFRSGGLRLGDQVHGQTLLFPTRQGWPDDLTCITRTCF
ncbi:hypothetical protein JCM9957A_58290 [Kineosporia succinea]